MPNEAETTPDFLDGVLDGAGFAEEQKTPPTPTASNGQHQPFDVPGFLARNGIRVKRIDPSDGGVKYVLEECPFDPSHKAPDSAVFVYPNGARSFKCLHNSCAAFKWQDLREKFEPGYRNKPRQQNEQQSHDDTPLSLPPTFREMDRDFPTLRPAIVHGLLREGETANFIAATKAGKSWLALNLALCVITGKRWLGTFGCVPGSVLVVDNELHPETITHRIRTVSAALDLTNDDFADSLRVESLRGKLRDINGLGQLLLRFKPGQFKLIVVDAFYRCLPRGTDENKNADVAAIYNTIDSYAERLKCAFASVHHATKGSQVGKGTTDIGSGAGSFSRAVDCHFVLRPHADKDVAVAEAALRSWPPLEPLALRWSYPLWIPDGTVDPASNKAAAEQAKAEELIRAALRSLGTGWHVKGHILERTGTSGRGRAIQAAWGEMLRRGEVKELEGACRGANNKPCTGFAYHPKDQQP